MDSGLWNIKESGGYMNIRIRKLWAVGLACAFTTVFLFGCAGGDTEAKNDAVSDDSAEDTSIDVMVQTPDIRSITVSSNFSGTVVAESEVNVIPLIGGEVVEKYFEVGDHVNEGDLLFKINDEALQIAVTTAEASLSQAKANLSTTQANAEVTKAQANVSRAQATQTVGEMPYNSKAMDNSVDSAYVQKKTANNNLKNAGDAVDLAKTSLDDLKKARDAAKQARDTAEAEFKALATTDPLYADKKKAYETAQSTYETAKSRVDSAEISLDQAKRTADNAEMGVYTAMEGYELAQMKRDNYNTYTVPTTLYGAYAQAVGANASDVSADNSITSSAATVKSAQAGLDNAKLNLEHANVTAPVSGTITAINVTLHNMATQTAAAYTIQSDEPNKVEFYVAEETARNIRPGVDAVVSKNGNDYPARILTVYDTVDANTGLFKIEASINSGADSSALISGTSVSIRTVTRRTDNAVTVPVNAVYYDGDQAYVYTEDGGVAKRVDVSVGLTDEDNVEITDGISASDRIVISWSGRLRDGTQLNVTEKKNAETVSSEETLASAGAGEDK